MANFQTCVDYVIKNEGGLSQTAADPGGTTNFGISLRFLRNLDGDALKRLGIFEEVTDQAIINLTKDQAEKIYYAEFWLKAPFEKIMNTNLAKYIFDMHVNHGLSQAVKITQRACCAVNRNKDYLKDDGLFGSKTVGAINYGSFMLIPALISERSGFMRQLVAVNPKLECFIEGWLNRAYNF